MTQQREKLLTAEEFFERYAGKDSHRYELVKGELVEMTSPGGVHGETAIAIGAALYDFVRRNNLGRVMVETGYTLDRDPDTVRGPMSPSSRPSEFPWGIAQGLRRRPAGPGSRGRVTLGHRIRDGGEGQRLSRKGCSAGLGGLPLQQDGDRLFSRRLWTTLPRRRHSGG